MPANSSHLCQSLDVACFSPLKQAYSGLLEQLIRTGYYHIEKVDFLDIYPEAHVQAFKKTNIQSAFKAAGIVPFNPSKVLDNLIFYGEESRPSSQGTTSTVTKIPKNLKQFRSHESKITQLLQETDPLVSLMQTALSYIFKGAEIALNRVVILEQENSQLREAVERRRKKEQRNQHQMNGLDGFTIQEGREAFVHVQSLEEAASDTGPRDDQPRRRAPPRCIARPQTVYNSLKNRREAQLQSVPNRGFLLFFPAFLNKPGHGMPYLAHIGFNPLHI
ncbi:transposase [Aspergillus affinis]|uniref:transposase n=1 Tax=Aspergillus affinis TaxID=1070780 RepID=UPI0022FEE8D3|nr:transposase [Aspergillus affinis]KAI9035070.1 transposase [Aspergillus affinis]